MSNSIDDLENLSQEKSLEHPIIYQALEERKKDKTQQLKHREKSFTFVLWILISTLIFYAAVILLDGFHCLGFSINNAKFGFLSSSIIVEIIAMFCIILNSLFKKQ